MQDAQADEGDDEQQRYLADKTGRIMPQPFRDDLQLGGRNENAGMVACRVVYRAGEHVAAMLVRELVVTAVQIEASMIECMLVC